MRRWELLGRARVPTGTEELTLHRRGEEYVIKVDGHLLMTNLQHASEDALAEVSLSRIAASRRPSVLVGGLGMGYTLAAALGRLGPLARVEVAELVPEVVEWNRGPLSSLAGHPLKDPRVTVLQEDLAAVLRRERGAYDAILQDVDNGPEGRTLKGNDWLYSGPGLAAASSALRAGGVLALWSAKPSRGFTRSLRRAGFEVSEVPVRGREGRRGHRYFIWIAARPLR